MVLNENKSPNDTIDAVEYNQIAATVNDITTNGLDNDLTVKGLKIFNYNAIQSITGVVDGGILSINAGDGTLFDISDGEGVVIDAFTDHTNSTITQLTWTGLTGITPVYNTNGVTYVGIQNNAGVAEVVQSTSEFTTTQQRDIIFLGIVVTTDGVNIANIGSGANNARGIGYLAADLSTALGTINVTGNVIGAGGTDLTVSKSAGVTFQRDINRAVDEKNPNNKTTASIPSMTWIYAYSDGAGGVTVVPGQTDIVPGSYDDGDGTLGNVSNNNYSVQRLWYFPTTGNTVVQYGQETYSTIDDAIQGVQNEAFDRLAPELSDDDLRCSIVLKGNATDLSDPTQALFFNTGKFGFGGPGGSGGAEGTQDLQSTYNLSSTPEIITDAVRGGVNFQGGTGTDTDNVIEINNNAGTLTADIQADGAASFLSISGDGSALTNVDAITLNGLTDTSFVKADGTVSMTGDLTLSSAAPTINLTETGGSVAWKLDVDADELAFSTAAGDTLILTEKELKIDNVAVFGSEFNNGNTSVDSNLDWNDGNFQKATLNQATTIFTFTDPSAVGRFQIKLVQDVSGSRLATWPANVKWPSGAAPTLSTAAGSIDIITFYYDGTDYYGVDSLNFQ